MTEEANVGSVGVNEELEKRLSRYATAATAAGVGLLAVTRSADAKIIYTPANINIPSNGGKIFLDLNHDGTADFSFWNTYSNGRTTNATLGVAGPDQSNGVWGKGYWRSRVGHQYTLASALKAGISVGSNQAHLQNGPWIMVHRGTYPLGDSRLGTYTQVFSAGQWPYTNRRYLGLKFNVDGETHYGWARLDVGFEYPQHIEASITGYAYETIPNKPIVTGKTEGPDVVTLPPATLGGLALGRK
ncbi:MAG TPA: hypothetical protein VF753_13740 [Terriglobales bacterium]